MVHNDDSSTPFNRTFWTSAFIKMDFERENSFLSDIIKEVFICGKSLNLLRICQPKHHLLNRETFPRVRLLVSPLEQSRLKTAVKAFVGEMEAEAEVMTSSLMKEKLKEEIRRKELLRIAAGKQEETLKRIQNERRAKFEAEKERKMRLFKDLESRFEDEKERKKEVKKREFDEDKKLLDSALKKEEEEIERENRVKREMTEYYDKLTAEAEIREKRAEWRSRRVTLRSKRVAFWREENRRQLKETPDNGDNSIGRRMDLSMVAEELNLSQYEIKAVKDHLDNVVLVVKDAESNLISENCVDFAAFTDLERSKILNLPFNELTTDVKDRLMEPVRNNGKNKRKRPQSFIDENSHKKLEKSLSAEEIPQKVETEAVEVYESLAAAISVDDFASDADDRDILNANVVRRRKNKGRKRPKSLSTIDGRKRVTSSKSIEQLLYPFRYSQQDLTRTTPVTPVKSEFNLNEFGSKVTSYRIDSEPVLPRLFKRRDDEILDATAFAPLTLLMQNSILIPLRAQMSLVNKAIVNYLLVDARIMHHFKALRNYLFLADGEFANSLCRGLFGLNETHLNLAALINVVENAVAGSVLASNDPCAKNVSFLIDDEWGFEPEAGELSLSYKTEWPANIFLTDEVVAMYGKVFGFLLKMRKALYKLDLAFNKLKKSKDLR